MRGEPDQCLVEGMNRERERLTGTRESTVTDNSGNCSFGDTGERSERSGDENDAHVDGERGRRGSEE